MVNRLITGLAIALSSYCAMGADKIQPGYIVNSNQDTVRGFVLIKDNAFNSRNCVFRSTADGAETTYAPGDIIAYGTSDKYFRSFADTSDPDATRKFFVECLVYGQLSLFFQEDDFFMERDNAIVRLVEVKKDVVKDGKTFVLKQPVYRSTLQAAMSDCKDIYKDVSSVNLTRKSLVNLFNKYHACMGSSAKQLAAHSDATAVRFGLGVNVIHSQLTWSQATSAPYLQIASVPGATHVSVVPSIWIEVWRPSLFNKLRLRTGVNFYSDTFQQTFVSTFSNQTYDFTLKNIRIELPVQVRYSFSGKGLYVIAGFGFSRSVVFDDKLVVKDTGSNAVLSENTSLEPAGFTLQLSGGLGFEFPVGNRSLFLQTDARITMAGVSKGANFGQPGINITMFSVTAGIPLSKDR